MSRTKKSNLSPQKKSSKTSENEKPISTKSKSLFDHINHIREVKSPNYFDTLSDGDLKSFNKYTLLMGLSMDASNIEEIAFVSKYFNIVPNKQFYTVLCDVVPHGRKFCKWIKSNKKKINKDLIDLISIKYQIGKDESYEYCTVLFKSEEGINEMVNICKQYGKSDKEIESILENE